MRKFVFAFLAVIASAWLLWLLDDGLELSWPSTALRNWQQFGVFTLHGSLIDNPGGFDVASHPHVYYGMSPWYLFPVYFCLLAFSWLGLGSLPYLVFLAALVFWGIWLLLGKNTPALLVAALVILCPGYGRWQKGLDPNAISVLLGIPYAALVVYLLKKTQLSVRHYALLCLTTVMFVLLNWTTAWFLGVFGVFLLLNRELRRRPVLVYLTLTAAGSIAFVGFSMLAKHHGGAAAAEAAPAAAGGFLGGYTWGAYGYYEGLSNARFFFRLFFVNLTALFPLLCWWAWEAARGIRKAPRAGWLSVLPVLMATAEVVAMRNYFCHHPWMASPVFIVGLVFSLAMLSSGRGQEDVFRGRLKWPVTAMICTMFYGLLVLSVYRANSRDGMSLAHLIQENIPRNEDVVVVKAVDPETAAISRSLGTQFDRHFVVVATTNDLPAGRNYLILSSVPASNLPLAAQTDTAARPTFYTSLANWFNHTIAHRKTGDRTNFAPHYYLYQPASQ